MTDKTSAGSSKTVFRTGKLFAEGWYSGEREWVDADAYRSLMRALECKQAKIDALMLEFCPGEMSAAQKAEWARHQRAAPETNERCMHGAVVCEKCASMAMRKVTPPVETQARLVREIRERHDRVSKLLWGPGAQPGMMLGPMDADAAHSDRGRLLSLLTPEQRGELKALEPRIIGAEQAGREAYLNAWDSFSEAERDEWTKRALGQ